MKIIVDTEWLNTCGLGEFAGQELEARHVPAKSAPSLWLGNYYEVDLPRGRAWAVYEGRGVTVVE